MNCENCLKKGEHVFLVEWPDAFSCPKCYIVSNQIVFGTHFKKKKY